MYVIVQNSTQVLWTESEKQKRNVTELNIPIGICDMPNYF